MSNKNDMRIIKIVVMTTIIIIKVNNYQILQQERKRIQNYLDCHLKKKKRNQKN